MSHLPWFIVVLAVEPVGNKRSYNSKQHTLHIVNRITVNHIEISESHEGQTFPLLQTQPIKSIN